MEWLFLLFIILGGGLLWLARRWSADAGLPAGRLISVDMMRHAQAAPVLVDPELNLTGKPDLLLETRRGWVPVEIKAGSAPARPHAAHVQQLTAYCRLVHAVHGRRPAYGILKYADQAIELAYTRQAESRLRRLISRIRAQAQTLPDRSHRAPARCAACGYLALCDQHIG